VVLNGKAEKLRAVICIECDSTTAQTNHFDGDTDSLPLRVLNIASQQAKGDLSLQVLGTNGT
jgi:hypothetical protein